MQKGQQQRAREHLRVGLAERRLAVLSFAGSDVDDGLGQLIGVRGRLSCASQEALGWSTSLKVKSSGADHCIMMPLQRSQ